MKIITKTFVILFMIMASISLFTSCEKVKSLADVKFDTELGGDINVMIGSGPQKSVAVDSYPFSGSVEVDMRDDDDIDKYFDKLKDFDIQDVTLTVKQITGGPAKIQNAEITVSSETGKALWLIKNFPLEPGSSVTLDNNNGQWDTVNDILDNKEDFTFSVQGTVDKTNISFTLYLGIKVKVTANPL